jgi:hypothetical protein
MAPKCMMKTNKPARTTAPTNHAAMMCDQWPVQGAASGSSKRAVSAGADDTEAVPLASINSVNGRKLCIRSFVSCVYADVRHWDYQ